jgi:hypothetical protein
MTEIEFQVVIHLKASINTVPIDELKKTDDKKWLIHTFIHEFLKYPSAVLSFYRCYFLDEYIEGAATDWMVLAKDLYYVPDYGPLFIEIAKNCPPEVTHFINNIFFYDGTSKKANIQREQDRKSLEAELRTLKVMNAQFIRSFRETKTPTNP